MPRDVVGGDIFFVESIGQCVVMAVVDCTGHGVPGAFMTMITISSLRRIIVDEGCHDPSDILSRLNFMVKTTLQQDTEFAISDDGLDAAVCSISIDKMLLTFAGARLPLIYCSDNQVIQIKGDRQSIGYKKSDLGHHFTNHTVHIGQDMSFYLFTDGFIDQLGGEKGFSFGKKRFENLLKEYYREPFKKQGEILASEFNKYKGSKDRLDDVTVAGFGRLKASTLS